MQMTDRRGKPWFFYRSREADNAGGTNQNRNSGIHRSPPFANWRFLDNAPWYMQALEADVLLGRRGVRGWDGEEYDLGTQIMWPKHEEPSWLGEVLEGIECRRGPDGTGLSGRPHAGPRWEIASSRQKTDSGAKMG